MTALKCPNPSCPFLFDPSQVPPGSVLACPQCGMRFTLGNTAPAAPPHGGPAESATMTLGAAPQFAGSATSGMPPAAPGFDSPSANPTLSYGQPPASYPGQPTNTFGGPPAAPPGYGPPPGYAAPPGYGPPPGYGSPPPGYGAPPPGYGAPPPGYGAPPPGYGPPSQLPSGSVQPVAPPPPPAPPRAPRKSGGGGIGSVLLVGFAAVAISGTVLGLIAFGVLGRGVKTAGSNRYDELNLLYDHPDKKSGWAKDENLMGPLNMFLAYSRVEPDAAIVFGGKDTKTRDPRPAELEEGVDGLLKRKFNQVRRDDGEMAGAKWLGQPCGVAYTFTAVTAKMQPTDEEVKVRGECYAVAHKGVAVWTVAWAPEEQFDGQLAAFAEARGRLRFNTLRDAWAPSSAATKTFRGQTPGYRVLDTDAVWAYPDPKKHPPAPPNADLYLRYDLKLAKGADMRKFAELEVTAVDDPGGEDPLELAIKAVKARYNINPDAGTTTLEDLTDEVKGETSANPAEGKTPTARFRTRTIPAVGPKVEDKSRTALVVVSGIKAGEKLIVLEARCTEWNNRELFEAALVKIAATLQEAK